VAGRDRATDGEGASIAFSGGVGCNDHRAIWDALDRVLAKHPDMILMYGSATKGVEFNASRWADASKVTQMLLRPDWSRHGKAEPFKRNDQLGEPQIGIIVFRAPASPTTSPTRRAGSGSRCGGSKAHERWSQRRPCWSSSQVQV
jgi:hypothetical protein